MKKQAFLSRHKVRSKLHEEKIRKKLIAEEEEKLDVMGQPDEHKAVASVTEEGKKIDQEEKARRAKELEIFTKARKTNQNYIRTLVFALHNLVNQIPFTKGYSWGVWFDGKGVRLTIKDKYKKVHQRAFKPSFSPRYDQRKMLEFTVWAEDVYDLAEGNLQSGIWTPPKIQLN